MALPMPHPGFAKRWPLWALGESLTMSCWRVFGLSGEDGYESLMYQLRLGSQGSYIRCLLVLATNV
jgi:hypothetical protein